jgi:hypothetical protein
LRIFIVRGKTVPHSIKKIVVEVIAALKKHPAPAKGKGSFWDFMKEQLSDEGTWDQTHLNVIEKEIHSHINKLDKKTLADFWKSAGPGVQKFNEGKKADLKEMKEDLTEELVGQVMDRMDDNYSSRDSFYVESDFYESTAKKEVTEEGDPVDDDVEPDKIENEELNLDEDDLFDEEEFNEEDETSF